MIVSGAEEKMRAVRCERKRRRRGGQTACDVCMTSKGDMRRERPGIRRQAAGGKRAA